MKVTIIYNTNIRKLYLPLTQHTQFSSNFTRDTGPFCPAVQHIPRHPDVSDFEQSK